MGMCCLSKLQRALQIGLSDFVSAGGSENGSPIDTNVPPVFCGQNWLEERQRYCFSFWSGGRSYGSKCEELNRLGIRKGVEM